jgi:hypothetical protein
MDKHNIIPIIEYFQQEVEPLEIAQLMDECISNYTDVAANNGNPLTKDDQWKLYNLKGLRNAILKCVGVHVFQ